MRSAVVIWSLVLAVPVGAVTDLWELPPVKYSETEATDRLAELKKALEGGEAEWPQGGGLALLRFVLKKLEVPESSQALVFSRTSLQNERIGPANPRALYFSPDAYVGYVPGGDIEVIVHDGRLGPVFYTIKRQGAGGAKIERQSSACFSCHGTVRTEHAPGVLVRSVFPDDVGQPILRLGSELVDHRTPLEDRWGGYYVTGRAGVGHFGNLLFTDDEKPQRAERDGADVLGRRVDLEKYPRPTSDVVGLMVLEHQCRVHNLITAAGMRYRRAVWMAKVLDPDCDPHAGTAVQVAQRGAEQIVEALLFKDEADLGEEIEGDEQFQQDFTAQFPKAVDGSSLADFRLYGRMFKNRCSYMVYSRAFRDMPEQLRAVVMSGLKTVLEGGLEDFDYLKDSERKRIGAILSETLPGFGRE